jgi:hypothetical protein
MSESEYIMCDSCNAVRINGVLCHEHGCPEAWKDKERECKFCGSKFKPKTSNQHFCDDSCKKCYYGE